jgi:rifampin ADP-ribosylating transferase
VSAYQYLSSRQFRDGEPARYFHGTDAVLEPGDFIEPGHPHNFPHLEGDPEVFFSPHVATAIRYANRGDGEGHVYQVEPTGPHWLDYEAMSRTPDYLQDSRRTDRPLRVVREVAIDRLARTY